VKGMLRIVALAPLLALEAPAAHASVVRFEGRGIRLEFDEWLRSPVVATSGGMEMEQAKRGRPTNPDHLLDPGELPRLVDPLEVIRQREGEVEGRPIASVAARRPASPPKGAGRRRAPGPRIAPN